MNLLLHVCCAPDATFPLQVLKKEPWDNITGYFYGSNIHPIEEYEKRVNAVNFLFNNQKTKILLRQYNPSEWLVAASELANEPEGERRCALCFSLQLRAAAEAGVKIGADYLCTTLTISPHKNIELISNIGSEIATLHDLKWENRIWRKNNGFLNSIQISKELNLYRQNYCGCQFSILH